MTDVAGSRCKNKKQQLLARLRYRSQIGFVRLEALRVFLLGVLIGNRGGNDHILARLPVHWCRHRVLGAELQRIEQTQHLVEVAAAGHRVDEHRLDLLVGPDEKYRAYSLVIRCGALAGVSLAGSMS